MSDQRSASDGSRRHSTTAVIATLTNATGTTYGTRVQLDGSNAAITAIPVAIARAVGERPKKARTR